MSTQIRYAMLAGLVLVWTAGVSRGQQPQPPATEGPVGAIGEVVTQYYALQLRDAEAKLRSAHERLAAPGSQGRRSASPSSAHQELLEAVRAAGDIVRHAPPPIAGSTAHTEAERRFRDGLARLDHGQANDADVARDMLQALSAMREATGAGPATGGPAPLEPAAGGGGRT